MCENAVPIVKELVECMGAAFVLLLWGITHGNCSLQ